MKPVVEDHSGSPASPFEKFAAPTRKLLAVPREEVDALEQSRTKRKPRRPKPA